MSKSKKRKRKHRARALESIVSFTAVCAQLSSVLEAIQALGSLPRRAVFQPPDRSRLLSTDGLACISVTETIPACGTRTITLYTSRHQAVVCKGMRVVAFASECPSVEQRVILSSVKMNCLSVWDGEVPIDRFVAPAGCMVHQELPEFIQTQASVHQLVLVVRNPNPHDAQTTIEVFGDPMSYEDLVAHYYEKDKKESKACTPTTQDT